MSLIGAALIGGGSQILSGLIGSAGQSSANKANLRIAREQMAFQERMSNTAYQRSAEDLEAAGLNRILALGSPASTPAGASARMENKKAPLAKGISAAVGTAVQAMKTEAEIENIRANTKGTDANTSLTNTRQLIATHGEEIASVAADIARTVRGLLGNKTPAQITALIKQKINEASLSVTNALESFTGTGKSMGTRLAETNAAISMYINDTINPSFNTKTYDQGRFGAYSKAQWREETKGRDISFEQWKKAKQKARKK